ncbi:DUF1361 domain-containing protein [Clostridium aciditolerans]
MFVFCRIIYRDSGGYLFLIWNIFLAWLPFYFSLIYTNYNFRINFSQYMIGLLWLIFYPNAPYILTDFIHLSKYKFYENKSYEIIFNSNFAIWYDFFLISIFVIIGLVLSFISLSIMHKYIKEKYDYTLGWLFILIICMLSSFGIYLGRFARVNSWELVTNPLYLLNVIFNSFNLQGLIFTILFGILILIFYLTFFLMNKYHS